MLSFATALLAAGCVESKCFDHSDCASPKVCNSEGICVYECSDEIGCPEGFGCLEHRCEPLSVQPIVCPPDMAAVADTYCVDLFEASRPDATADDAGKDGSIARSVKGVLPWQVESNEAAGAACAAAGKRLCGATEWELACRGPADTVYGYGDDYSPDTCNGIDAFGRPGFHLAPTGSFPACTNDWGVFDMNGNLWEHVAGGSDKLVRGGAFNCNDSMRLHRCDYVPGSWTPAARGFRCCLTPESQDGGEPDARLSEDAGGAEPDSGCVGADAGEPDAGEAGEPEDAGDADAGADVSEPEDAGSPSDAGAPDAGRCPPEMAEGPSRCIDRWEASRADATSTTQGTSTVPTSRPGVQPWWPVTTAQAKAACEAAGKQLCRSEEWAEACRGPGSTAYAYGDTYRPTACNGIDAFCDCESPSCSGLEQCPYPHCYHSQPDGGSGGCGASFHVEPTGSFPECASAGGVFDLNGNLWEVVDSGPDAGPADHCRGGAYNCGDSETLHRCDTEVTWGPPARGFRCCKDLP